MTTIAPPPAGPPPLAPATRSALRAMFVVVAVALVGGSVIALGVAAFGLGNFRVLADEKPLPGDIRTLVIDTTGVPAAVRVTTDRDATEPRVSMRLVNTVRSGEQTLTIAEDVRKATVTITGRTPGFLSWARTGQITVTLPPALARDLSVTVAQDAGMLLAQADLDELIARGTDGAVVLSGSARRIEVSNENGDVVTRTPISVTESFTAVTRDGDVVVDFKDAAPRVVEATSTTGDVALEVPVPGPYLVRAASDWNTTVRVPETGDAARAVAEITARSSDGSVTVAPLSAGDESGRKRR